MSGSRSGSGGSSWRKPATRVYDYNYNLGEHYYKPQLRHMEDKFRGRAVSPPKAKTFAERFADDPVYGCGPATWRPSTHQSGSSQPRRSSDDFGLRAPPSGDIFSSNLDDRGRPRFSLGDRLLDSVGVGNSGGSDQRGGFGRGSSPAPRGGPGISSPRILDDAFDEPFFQRTKKIGWSDGSKTADADFMTDDPFKSRGFFSRNDSADDTMEDMKLDAASQVARFRSKMRAKRAQEAELEEAGGSDDFGSAMAELRADRVRSRAKAKLSEIEDEFPSISIKSGRAKDSSSLASRLMDDMDSSSSGIKSIRISKRSVRSTVDD